MRQVFIQLSLALLLSAVAPLTLAQQFVETFSGTLTYPSGRTEPLRYQFAFMPEQGQTYFYAGQQRVATDSVPANYMLHVIVNKQGELHVGEFSRGSLHGFEFRVGEHHVKFSRVAPEAGKAPSFEDYRVEIDGRNVLLDTTHPTIMFSFDETGIVELNGTGYKKDLSVKSIE